MTGPGGRTRLLGALAAVLLVAAVWNVVAALRAEPVCLVTSADGCLDARLTGRADARVSSIDTEDGRGLWYVRIDRDGATVQGVVTDWPPSPAVPGNGPRLGQTVRVAFDPADPAAHVTDAAALDRALADAAGDPHPEARLWGLATGLLLAAAVLGVLARRRPTRAEVTG